MKLPGLEEKEAFEFYRSFLEFISRWSAPQSYLEIGVRSGETFRRLRPHCESLTGVDPGSHDWAEFESDPRIALHRLTSDEFFLRFPEKTFDLVFIDGCHEQGQVTRDIRHALRSLRPNGMIVAHDTLPPSREWTDQTLCGDAYKSAILLRKERELEVFTFPVRCGLTLIGKVGDTFPWTEE